MTYENAKGQDPIDPSKEYAPNWRLTYGCLHPEIGGLFEKQHTYMAVLSGLFAGFGITESIHAMEHGKFAGDYGGWQCQALVGEERIAEFNEILQASGAYAIWRLDDLRHPDGRAITVELSQVNQGEHRVKARFFTVPNVDMHLEFNVNIEADHFIGLLAIQGETAWMVKKFLKDEDLE